MSKKASTLYTNSEFINLQPTTMCFGNEEKSEMHSDHCKNCNAIISGNYCVNCGQKTSVHRYSFQHFVTHDLVHGVWHVDSGILFTIKELFTRPGNSIREFINGKRVGYFSFVTLLVLIFSASHFLSVYATVTLVDLAPESSKGAMNELQKFTQKNPKAMLLITIPFYSFLSFLWFRKSNLNLTEHFVLNSYKTVAESLIALSFLVFTIFYTNIPVLTIIYGIFSFGTLVYAFWFYKQFFSGYGYSNRALIFRSLAVIFSYMFLTLTIGIVMALLDFGK